MIIRLSGALLLAGLCALLLGCGSGGGGSSIPSRVQERAIATTRNSRAIFAIAGMGMTGITGTGALRGPARRHTLANARAGILLGAIQHTRAASSGYDEDLKLFYTASINADGSGRQDLFEDTAHTVKAGSFVWPAPTKPGTYPLTFQEAYHIGRGELDGERGTLDVTFNDATGNNGALHLANTNAKGEKVDTRLALINGVLTAHGEIQTPSGDRWTETDVYNEGGQWVCKFDFPDGSRGQTTGDGEGEGKITYYGPDGALAASGTYDSDGDANLTYSDGATQSVNVDDWSDGSYDDTAFWSDPVWDDVPDAGSEDRAARRRAPRKPSIRRS
jgi:hypothetical protein